MKINILTARTDRRVHTFRIEFMPDAGFFENRIAFEGAEISGEYSFPFETGDFSEDDVLLKFEIHCKGSAPCDRCGTTAKMEAVAAGGEIVKKGKPNEPSEDGMIDGREDYYSYEGDEIELDRIANEALLLGMPTRHLCRTDCKGLCPKCGKNLNDGDCECTEDYSGSPFAKLLNLKK